MKTTPSVNWGAGGQRGKNINIQPVVASAFFLGDPPPPPEGAYAAYNFVLPIFVKRFSGVCSKIYWAIFGKVFGISCSIFLENIKIFLDLFYNIYLAVLIHVFQDSLERVPLITIAIKRIILPIDLNTVQVLDLYPYRQNTVYAYKLPAS